MKITRKQLRRLIKEVIDVHQVPVDLDTVDSEEAYGIGYMKGKEQDLDSDDDGFSGTVELVDPGDGIVDDIDTQGQSIDQMPASWQQILGNSLGEKD
jgi:hypothetical protein